MDEALELVNFLPFSFKSPSEREYVEFLWEAFQANCASGKYQFAFLAYHMLTMSFVYFKVWQIRQARNPEFQHGLIGFGKEVEKSLLEAATPFAFSTVPERSILRLLKLIDCDNSKIGAYAKLVDDRNDTAHPNGNVFYREVGALEVKVREVMRAVREIQLHSQSSIEAIYAKFLTESADPDQREFEEDADQIREALIHSNYLSAQDIRTCMAYDPGQFSAQPMYGGIQALHESLKGAYSEEVV
jgi:hypothetical protein